MKHTPGPWEVIEDNGDYYVRGNCLTIADCTSWDYQTRQPACPAGVGEAEANGRLIAAAPELLGALKNLADYMIERGMEHDDGTIAAMAAIAKAEGVR